MLGSRLGPDWTAEDLTRWVTRQRRQALLEAPRDPVAYLRAVLDEVLTGPGVPPHPARRATEHRRAAAAAASGNALRARWAAQQTGHAATSVECDWPEVAQPGSGLPSR